MDAALFVLYLKMDKYIQLFTPQWLKVNKYIYTKNVLKYNFEVLVLYLSIFNYFILLLLLYIYREILFSLHYIYSMTLV